MDLLDQLNEVLLQQPRKYWGDKAIRLGSLLSDSAATGAQAYGSANSPMAPEHANTLAGLLADFTPVVGDAKSAYDGLQSAREGDYLGAALGGLGALPLMPNMAGVISPVRRQAKEAYKANKELFDNVHKAQNLQFQAIPINQLSDAVSIYKSPRYGTRAPSEYAVGIVNGSPAYIRKSDHWGKFTTNIKEGTDDAKLFGLGDEVWDQFGRVGFKPHNWELQGGIGSKFAERADEAFAMRSAMTPEQRYGSGREREIAEKLWDEYYALTHSGKREAGYIPLSKLIEGKK